MTVLDADRRCEAASHPPGADPFGHWSALHEGFAPLYCAAIMRDAFAELTPALGPGSTGADLGCGTGHAAQALAACGGFAVGLDLDPGILALGRRDRPARQAVAGDLERLPFGDATLDVAFSFSAFQYVDRGRALRELHRVLKPGGRFAIVENLRDNPVALARRIAWKLMRTPYRGTVPPRRHPRWDERFDYTRIFPNTQFRTYHLFSPLLLASGRVLRAPADAPAGAGIRRVLEAVERLDNVLLRRLPGARAAAWLLLATGRKT